MVTLVAGGAGFIGSHLCERLMAASEDVICLDNLITGRFLNISTLLNRPGFTFVQHDLIEPLPSLPSIHAIYHLASPASPPAYQRYPIETMRVNSEGTLQLLDLAARDSARFLFASTSEIYGDPLEHPQNEHYWGNVNPVGPRAMYDEAKRYGEALTMAYASSHGVDTRIARIFNTYGPRLDPRDGRVVSNFTVQALRGIPLTIYGDGSQTRSFQYIDDLIEGLLRLMGSSVGAPMNLGNPDEYTMLQLATTIRDLTASASTIEFHPLPIDDPRQRQPDISFARSALGWQPRIGLSEGLGRMIAYLRKEIEPATSPASEVPVNEPMAIPERNWLIK